MSSDYKLTIFGQNLLIILIFSTFLLGTSPFFERQTGTAEADLIGLALDSLILPELVILQENSLVSFSNPTNSELEIVRQIKVVITGYSSSPWETDGSPYITASGNWVREGIIASNLLPFGTKVRIPEIYGDKIFVVEDRMHWRKGYYHIDIWFSDYWQALNFGAKRTYIEILGG